MPASRVPNALSTILRISANADRRSSGITCAFCSCPTLGMALSPPLVPGSTRVRTLPGPTFWTVLGSIRLLPVPMGRTWSGRTGPTIPPLVSAALPCSGTAPTPVGTRNCCFSFFAPLVVSDANC